MDSEEFYSPENSMLNNSSEANGLNPSNEPSQSNSFNASISTSMNSLTTSESNSRKRKRTEIEEKINQKNFKLAEYKGEEPFIKLVLNEEDKPVNIYCEVCKNYYSTTKGGTYYKHIEKCKNTLHPELLPPANVTNDQKISFRKTMVQSAAKDLMPFTFYESEGYKECIQTALDIGYQSVAEGRGPPKAEDILCSRRTLSRELYQDVAETKGGLFSYIGDNIKSNGGSITIDMTSKKKHFVGTVFHFIDNEWKMKTFPIDIHEFKKNSTAENIKADCEKLLEGFGLDINDLFTVTDEGSNVVAAFGGDGHILCSCHVLHTVCKRSLDPYKAANIPIELSNEIKSDLARINTVVKTMKTVVNAVRARLILRNELSCALIVDCDTRWMTKLKMIRHFLKLNATDLELIEQKFKDEKKNDLINSLKDTIKDRSILELVVEVFTPFETAIRALEAEKTPTLNLVIPTIKTLEIALYTASTSDDHFKSSLGKSALEVLKFKTNKLITETHAFALILDPLHKKKLSTHINFRSYKNKFEEKVKSISTSNENAVSTANDESPNPYLDDEYIKAKNYKRELELYFEQKPDPENYDLLTWWKENENRFPTLAKLASKILSIPASSASIERLFSILNLMTPAERSNLCNETLKNLVLYRAVDLQKM